MKKLFVLLLAAMPLLVGCNDFDPFRGSETGKPITFSANTYYQNGIGTRTEYSGEFFGETTKYERIDWVDTDLMRVWAQVDASNTANGDYVVESHQTDTGNGQNSNAKVKSVANPLTWLSDANHTIYALYPSPATDNVDANKVSLNANVVTATIPATQEVTAQSGSSIYKPDMNYAYMWAATQAVPGSNVALGFKPLMTAFEFSVRTADDGAGLSSFSLVADDDSPYIAGDFTAAISEDLSSCAITSIANGSRTITVNFDNATTAPSGSLTFTIFALPQELTHLTMQFTMSDGTVKELALKQKDSSSDEYQFITFEAGTKYRITNVGVPGDGWTYTLEEVEPGTAMARTSAAEGSQTKEVKSYRTKGDVIEEVSMQFEYSPADDEGNNLEQWSADLPEWLVSLVAAAHTDEQDPDDPFTLTGTYTGMPELTEETMNQITDHIASLKAKGSNSGSETAPQDLALYDIDNLSSPRAAGAKTANSYVVNKAGWYMFPLVYGNAIDCQMGNATNNWNVNSYSAQNLIDEGITPGNDGTVLKRFRNYTNTAITSPYILDDTGLASDAVEAIIIWEDVAEDNMFIKANTVDLVELASTAYKAGDGSSMATVPFIRFQVDPEDIRQGNAVIALREKSGDKRIIWSWQIWVTDSSMSTVTVNTRSSTVTSNQLLTKPLGFCDERVEIHHYYVPRKYFVKVTQVQGDAAPVVFAVTQSETDIYVSTFTGMTHYQYGRKDPFLPITSVLVTSESGSNKGGWRDPYCTTPRNKDHYSHPDYTVQTDAYTIPDATFDAEINASIGIQNPYSICHDGGGLWIGYQNYRNLWNMCEYNAIAQPSNDDNYVDSRDRKVYKTIYDPCPPGFSVPGYSAFTIFTVDGNCHSIGQEDQWNVDFDASGIFGFYYYVNDDKSATIYLPNGEGRRSGKPVPVASGSPPVMSNGYYLTAKAKGSQYSCAFTKSTYWVPPGPVAELSLNYAFAVLPAKEIQ